MIRKWLFVLTALSAFGLTQSVFAQGGAVGSDKSELQIRTEFLEAHKLKKWDKVEQLYDENISRFFPQLKRNDKIVYRYCEALYNLGQKRKSYDKLAEALEKLINRNPKYVEAIYLFAQARASSKKPEHQEEAKDHLLTVARLGLPVIREISDKKNKNLFGYLLNEPRFILQVMRASQNVGPFDSVLNPFKPPFEPDAAGGQPKLPAADTITTDENKELLEAQVEKLISEVEELLERQEVDQLLPKFKELNGLMAAYEKLGTEVVRAKLKEWRGRSKDFPDVQMALQLQVYVTEGNRFLKQMAKALQNDEFDSVAQGFQQITTLVDKMRAEEREAFVRNAETLYYRAKEFNDKAVKRKRIRELELLVTGIILDPGPATSDRQSGHRAIINDKIYREGDVMTDELDEPIADLSVTAILEGAVRFKYQDTSFVRELKPPPN